MHQPAPQALPLSRTRLFLVLRGLWASRLTSRGRGHRCGHLVGWWETPSPGDPAPSLLAVVCCSRSGGPGTASVPLQRVRVTTGPGLHPRSFQPFQIRQTLKARHLDVGRGGSRHGRLIATLQFGDGAGHTPSYAKPRPRHQSPAAQHAFSVQLAAHGEWVGL